MICKTGLKNMVRPMLLYIYGQGVYGTVLDATKAFDRIDYCKLCREMIKMKNIPLLVPKKKKKKKRDSCQLYRDTNRVTSIVIHRCIDESCQH